MHTRTHEGMHTYMHTTGLGWPSGPVRTNGSFHFLEFHFRSHPSTDECVECLLQPAPPASDLEFYLFHNILLTIKYLPPGYGGECLYSLYSRD